MSDDDPPIRAPVKGALEAFAKGEAERATELLKGATVGEVVNDLALAVAVGREDLALAAARLAHLFPEWLPLLQEPLRACLAREDASVTLRAEAAASLALGAPLPAPLARACVEALGAALREPAMVALTVDASLGALIALGPAAAALEPDVLPWLEHETLAFVAACALVAVAPGQLPRASALLQDALRSEDAERCWRALEVVGALPELGMIDPALAEALTTPLRAGASEVRALAADVLGRVGPAARDVALAALAAAGADADDEVRRHALDALARHGEHAVELLLELLRRAPPERLDELFETLEGLGPSAIPALEAGLAGLPPELQDGAQDTLRRLREDDAGTAEGYERRGWGYVIALVLLMAALGGAFVLARLR